MVLLAGCFDSDFFTEIGPDDGSSVASDMFVGDLPFLPGTDAKVERPPSGPTYESCVVTRIQGNGQFTHVAADGTGGSFLGAGQPGTIDGVALEAAYSLVRVEPDGTTALLPLTVSVAGIEPAPAGAFVYGHQLPEGPFLGVEVTRQHAGAFVARMDNALRLQWLLSWTGGLAPRAAASQLGSVLVTANTGAVSILRAGDDAPVYQGDPNKLGMVARFASDGSLLWGHPVGDTSGRVGAVAANINAQGVFAVEGAAIELWDGTQLTGVNLVGVTDGGDVSWTAPVASGVAIDHLALDPNGSTWMLGHTLERQLVVARYDPAGTQIWQHVVETRGNATWSGVTLSGLQHAYVLGAHDQPFLLGNAQMPAGVFLAALRPGDGAVAWVHTVAPALRIGAIDATGRWLHAAISSFETVSWPPRDEAPVAPDGVSAAFGLELE